MPRARGISGAAVLVTLSAWIAASLPGIAFGQAFLNANYDATTGTLPTVACPPYDLVVSGTPPSPVVTGGALIISTSTNAQNLVFRQTGPNFAINGTLVVEFRAKLDSGSSSHPARGPIAVAITTAASTGTLFFADSGEIFLNSANLTKGDTEAVATADDFHTYRIEVTTGGTVSVSYDGVPKLSGATYSHATDFASTPQIFFGDGGSGAFGQSEWQYFRHNAGGIPCVHPTYTSVYDAATGLLPHELCPPWSLVNQAGGSDPYLSSGRLFFSTGLDGAREFYWRPEISIPDTLVVEFRAQLDFGSSSNPARGPANVLITTAAGVGHLFHMNTGEIFFAAGHGGGGQLLKGPTASVPTTGAFHTYRLEVVGNSVAAYYDGTRKLISSSYTDTLDHGLVARIAFGEGSIAAQGQSEWEYIRHNAGLPTGPPILFSLQTPSQGDTVPTWRVPLDWTNSVDPDCVAPVSYYVEIDSVSSFPSPMRYGPRAASQDTVVVPFAQGLSWYWRVRAKDAGGDSTLATPAFGRFVTYNAGYPTAVESPAAPRTLAIFPGRPNPFNPSTRIEFELPGSTAARVRANIYTVQGRRVRRLLDANKPPGRHSVTWDGKDDPGRDAASGVYYFVLRTADGSRSIKLVLAR